MLASTSCSVCRVCGSRAHGCRRMEHLAPNGAAFRDGPLWHDGVCVVGSSLPLTLPSSPSPPPVPIHPFPPPPPTRLPSGMHYMHDRGVAHLDITLENVALKASTMDAKLIDFGCVGSLPNWNGGPMPRRRYGKPPYMAPEVRVVAAPVSGHSTTRAATVFCGQTAAVSQ